MNFRNIQQIQGKKMENASKSGVKRSSTRQLLKSLSYIQKRLEEFKLRNINNRLLWKNLTRVEPEKLCAGIKPIIQVVSTESSLFS